jgi:hypothetical protein
MYQNQTAKSNSDPTTCIVNPIVEGIQVETWNHFGEEVQQFMACHVFTVTKEPLEGYIFKMMVQNY